MVFPDDWELSQIKAEFRKLLCNEACGFKVKKRGVEATPVYPQ